MTELETILDKVERGYALSKEKRDARHDAFLRMHLSELRGRLKHIHHCIQNELHLKDRSLEELEHDAPLYRALYAQVLDFGPDTKLDLTWQVALSEMKAELDKHFKHKDNGQDETPLIY